MAHSEISAIMAHFDEPINQNSINAFHKNLNVLNLSIMTIKMCLFHIRITFIRHTKLIRVGLKWCLIKKVRFQMFVGGLIDAGCSPIWLRIDAELS